MPNKYNASLNVSLAPQHQGLYGQLDWDLYHDQKYSRNLAYNLPFSLESLGKGRVVLLFDSTWLPKTTSKGLLLDVILFTQRAIEAHSSAIQASRHHHYLQHVRPSCLERHL